ncbi:hypothetical protein FDH96_gp038 [Mycobacterium phage Rey]|uniref:Uncharacterized protein n=1 Tax=Mycobacterium phage Rey TaxID=1034115 RepID=G1D5A0_9CAUD|nr:hypothetical protein FDH96_gp038 [Mycobacterium phage Rey]AEK09950.1 hypothetical protein PBI_REY_38 [Mycobacterium phage Rey]
MWPELFGMFGGIAGTGGLAVVMWQSVFRPKVPQITETEAVQKLSAAIREEIRKENAELRKRMEVVVTAVVGLVDLLDDLFPKITGLTDEERIALRHKINLAKLTT